MVTQNAWNSENPAQVAKGGTGVSSATAYAVICGGTASTGPFQSIAGVGSSGEVLTSNGAAALPTFQSLPSGGIMVQQVRSSTSSVSSTTSVIPVDNTIPQNTEGAELLTAAITPTSATNILMIEFAMDVTLVGAAKMSAAFFVDSTVDAIAAYPMAGYAEVRFGRYFLVAGSTSARTYKLRYGPNGGGTMTINLALYGGVCFSSFVVTEIEV